jgi:NADH dehydrogenase
LIFATGSKTNFFGNKDIQRYNMSMKIIPQSLNISIFVLTNDSLKKNALMNFVLAGAGPTEVPLARAFIKIKKGILQKDYSDLYFSKMNINLIQSGDKILNIMNRKSSDAAEKFFKKLGVIIWKNI